MAFKYWRVFRDPVAINRDVRIKFQLYILWFLWVFISTTWRLWKNFVNTVVEDKRNVWKWKHGSSIRTWSLYSTAVVYSKPHNCIPCAFWTHLFPRRWEEGKRTLQFTKLCNIRGSWKTEILCRTKPDRSTKVWGILLKWNCTDFGYFR